MLRLVCIVLCGNLWIPPPLAGQPAMSASGSNLFEALNAYMIFANECMHVAGEIRPGLEQFNEEANTLRLANGKGVLSYTAPRLFAGDVFRPALTAVCSKAPGDTEIHLRHLYETTTGFASQLPPDFRIALNDVRDELMYRVIALRSLTDSLRKYAEKGQYLRDPGLTRAYAHLTGCMQHFDALSFQQQRLEDIRQQIVLESHPALRDLETLARACRSIILHIRNNNAMGVRTERFSLAQSINDADARQAESLRALRKIGLDYDEGKVVYTHIMDYGREILSRTEAFLQRRPASPAYLNYPDAYYYYNERLLSLFNHQKYGLLAYYNRFLRFASSPQPLHLELAPSFLVIAPIKPPKPAPPVAKPALQLDAPANHLVFLVDVSSSMDKPEKMGLLRQGLLELTENLRPEDHLSIVTFSTRPEVRLEAVSAVRQDALKAAIKALIPQGETNVIKGFRTAYDLASTYYIPKGNNRVILVSDGDFTLKSGMTRLINKQAVNGTELSVFLFSKFAQESAEQNLRNLARYGKGNYVRVQNSNVREIMLQEARLLTE